MTAFSITCYGFEMLDDPFDSLFHLLAHDEQLELSILDRVGFPAQVVDAGELAAVEFKNKIALLQFLLPTERLMLVGLFDGDALGTEGNTAG